MNREITYHRRPRLNRPAMIMSFSGWADAGEISTGVFKYLRKRLAAEPLASISENIFFDFTRDRPEALIEAGFVTEYRTLPFDFHYAAGLEGQGDIILFNGREPQLMWDRFCDLTLEIAREMDVSSIYTLGGTYDYVPHWLDSRISAVYSDKKAADQTAGLEGLRLGAYEGPVSIHTHLLARAAQIDLPVVGLWGHAPVYIQTGNLKLHHALVEILKQAIGFPLDTNDLAGGIAAMNRQIGKMAAESPKLRQYLDELRAEFKDQGAAGEVQPIPEPTNGKVIPFPPFPRKTEK